MDNIEEQQKRGIVIGQHAPEKRELARRFRSTMTMAERKLWAALRASKLVRLHFRRQQVIDGFIVDFYCHAAGLVIEIDGAVHNNQTEYDAERTQILSHRGLRILRFTNHQVINDLDTVLATIVTASTSEPAT